MHWLFQCCDVGFLLFILNLTQRDYIIRLKNLARNSSLHVKYYLTVFSFQVLGGTGLIIFYIKLQISNLSYGSVCALEISDLIPDCFVAVFLARFHHF